MSARPPHDPITPGQAAERHGVNRSRIHALLKANRIPGAFQLESGQWLIPNNFKIIAPPERKRSPHKLPITRRYTKRGA